MAKTLKPKVPYIFVSHDSKDYRIADAFSKLLNNISHGILKTFQSSNKLNGYGIDYGVEWYPRLMLELSKATDIICLLTSNSLDRPWILFEAGVAKGITSHKRVFGVALGVPNQQISGPFTQFQNCGEDRDSLFKLLFDLLKQIPNITPSEEIILHQVDEFIKIKDKLIHESQQQNLQRPKFFELPPCEFTLLNNQFGTAFDCFKPNDKPWQVCGWDELHWGNNQRWMFHKIAKDRVIISSLESNYCLENSSKGKLTLSPFDGQERQQWIITRLEDHSFKIVSAENGQCLDAWREKNKPDTIVHLWEWHGGRNQRWWINPIFL